MDGQVSHSRTFLTPAAERAFKRQGEKMINRAVKTIAFGGSAVEMHEQLSDEFTLFGLSIRFR